MPINDPLINLKQIRVEINRLKNGEKSVSNIPNNVRVENNTKTENDQVQGNNGVPEHFKRIQLPSYTSVSV